MKIPINRGNLLKVLKFGGYAFFGLVVFIVSFFLTLPEKKIAHMIENSAARSGIGLRIGEISIGMFGNISLQNVVVQTGSAIKFDEAEISLRILRALLKGELSGKFSAKLLGGEVTKGRFSVRGNDFSIEAGEILNVDIGKSGKGLPLFGTFLKGKLSGKFVVNIRGKDLSAGNGYAQFTIHEGQLVKPSIKTKNYGEFTLSDMDLGKVDIELILDRRSNIPDLRGDRKSPDGTVIYFKKAEISGTDFQARMERNSVIRLFEKKPLHEGAMNLSFVFKFDDVFYQKSVEGETPNMFLKTVFSADMRWRQAESAGFYGMVCTGTVKNPYCLPKRPEIRGVEYAASREKSGRGEEAKEVVPRDVERKALERPPKVMEREEPIEQQEEESGATGVVNFKRDNVLQKVFPRVMTQSGVNMTHIQKVIQHSGEEGGEKTGEEHPHPIQPLEKEKEQLSEGTQVINPQEAPPPQQQEGEEK